MRIPFDMPMTVEQRIFQACEAGLALHIKKDK